MNKRVLSTSLSLACHTLFLIAAFNLALTPPSMSEPISPPILIHVHLEARPLSPSMGNNGKILQKKNANVTPPLKIKKINKPVKKHSHPDRQTLVMNAPVPFHKPVVSNDHVVTVVRQNMPALHMPAQHEIRKTAFSAQEVFKDMSVADRKIADPSIMPVSDVSAQMQQIQMQPTTEPDIQNYQGATPFLPFDQNGSGTDIKAFLGYDLYTYEDPADHVKYFKLSIKVEDIPGSLDPLPKEITFLVDASGSITDQTLNQEKEAIGKVLDQLGMNDKFNIIAFTDQVSKMQPRPVDNTLENLYQGKSFINNFRSISTDLYDTVLKTVNTPQVMKPSYIVLISDGQPTAGVVDSTQIINQIAASNKNRLAIFGLGVNWANEYLMNFLTFTNHGWSEFVPLNAENSLIQLYGHIKDPVLTYLRYFAIGLDKNEMYPKQLPDLFKGSEFVMYGRYTAEDSFTFRLRGDTPGDVKQYIVNDKLSNGKQGDETIAQEWAMRKIYDLIGSMQYNQDNQAIIDQVNQLAFKFGLKIPAYKVNK